MALTRRRSLGRQVQVPGSSRALHYQAQKTACQQAKDNG